MTPETLIYGWVAKGGKVYSGEGYPVPWRKFHIDRDNCVSLLLACRPPAPPKPEPSIEERPY